MLSQFSLRAAFLSFLCIPVIHCSSRAVLRVTPEHQLYLRDIDSGTYKNGGIKDLFTVLEVHGDAICNMIFENTAFDEETAKNFSTTLNFRKPAKQKWYNNVLPSLIAGCFNFFKMNDRGVDGIFRLLESMYPEAKDCFTVGFAQYYMMYQEMNCDHLISIDADWRILKAHLDFHEIVRNKPDGADTISLLRSIELGWIAHFDVKPPRREEVQSELTFCMATERDRCLRAFEHFTGLPSIRKTELQLGFIHDAVLSPRSADVSIVFMSNALDWEYTTREQFEKLYMGMHENLPRGKKVAIVYQSGDSEDIAIYEMQKGPDNELHIGIRCRDWLRWSDRYTKTLRGKSYDTWFDELLDRRSMSGIPRCHVNGTRNFREKPKPEKKPEPKTKT